MIKTDDIILMLHDYGGTTGYRFGRVGAEYHFVPADSSGAPIVYKAGQIISGTIGKVWHGAKVFYPDGKNYFIYETSFTGGKQFWRRASALDLLADCAVTHDEV